MADPAGRKLLRIPGSLIQDPTNLALAKPYGGTFLGLVRDVLLLVDQPFFEIPAEEYGPAEWVDAIELGARYELRCSLRDWDDDAFAAVFPNTAVGGTDGRTGISTPGTRLPGAAVNDRTISVLYAPDDTTAPAIYLRSAFPLVARRVEVNLGHTGDSLWALRFVGRRDPTTENASVQWNTLADITL